MASVSISTVNVPKRIHLVGSLPFKSTEEAFEKTTQALPNRLYTIPDGETGTRGTFVRWQGFVFPKEVHGPLHRQGRPLESTTFNCTIDHIQSTKYDEAAIQSYAIFQKLRSQNIVPKGTRFQVSIPTPTSSVWTHVDFLYRERVQPLYLARLLEDVRHLQNAIPPEDLAIQIDCAIEFAYIEYERGRLRDEFFKPSYLPVKERALSEIVQLASEVHKDVALGFHLCYGDRGGQHFIQPKDAGVLAEMATEIKTQVGQKHPIEWIHLPVPKNRSDDSYFEPLRRLDLGTTLLVLGLVHAHDEEGTKERLKAAQAAYIGPIGVATECGMGRVPVENMESIFSISTLVTSL